MTISTVEGKSQSNSNILFNETELYKDYSERIYVYVRKNLWDSDKVLDIVQDIFIALISNLRNGKLKDKKKIQAYIYGIARNIIHKANHQKTTEPKEIQNVDRYEHYKSDSTLSIQEKLEKDEYINILKECISKLSSLDNNIILHCFFENKNHKEIAQKYKLSPNYIGVRKFRAIKALKDCLLKNNFFM